MEYWDIAGVRVPVGQKGKHPYGRLSAGKWHGAIVEIAASPDVVATFVTAADELGWDIVAAFETYSGLTAALVIEGDGLPVVEEGAEYPLVTITWNAEYGGPARLEDFPLRPTVAIIEWNFRIYTPIPMTSGQEDNEGRVLPG